MKKPLIWIAAILITLGVSVYQRKTGPTYPLKIKTEFIGEKYVMNLTRSASIGKGCKIEIPSHKSFDSALIVYHKYPGNHSSDTTQMQLLNNKWSVLLPVQPAAGKLQYYVVLLKEGKKIFDNQHNSAIVRFKGDVPAWVLVPHIIFMFFSMLFGAVVLLMAIFNIGNYRRMSILTLLTLIVGGFILGPIMQFYAFGEAWTGWPVGSDLTDNKTLIAAIFWILAIVISWKKPRRWTVITASVIMIGVFSIPHSAGGSEYNYDAGKIETGLKK